MKANDYVPLNHLQDAGYIIREEVSEKGDYKILVYRDDGDTSVMYAEPGIVWDTLLWLERNRPQYWIGGAPTFPLLPRRTALQGANK